MRLFPIGSAQIPAIQNHHFQKCPHLIFKQGIWPFVGTSTPGITDAVNLKMKKNCRIVLEGKSEEAVTYSGNKNLKYCPVGLSK